MGQDARQPGWQGGWGGGGEDAEPTDREIVLKTGLKRKMKAETETIQVGEAASHLSF